MKKSLLFAALLAMGLTASAQAPFAYSVQTAGVNDHQVTVGYYLNANATRVAIQIADAQLPDTPVKTIEFTEAADLDAGNHSVALDLSDLSDGTYTYSVVVDGAGVEVPTKVGPTITFWSPYGIAIDNDPMSDHFGRILVTESQATVNGRAAYWTSNTVDGVGPGIYAFDPQMNKIANESGRYGFDAGIGFQNYSYAELNGGSGNMFGPKKVRITDDGRIFLGTLDVRDNAPLYEINPDDLNDWTPVFEGVQSQKENSDYNLFTEDGEFVGGYSAAMDFRGTGDDLTFVNLSCKYGQAFSYGAFQTYEYQIGKNTKISDPAAEENELFPISMQYTISAQTVNLAYDEEGNVWYAQYRGSPNDAQPSLKYVYKNIDGEWDEGYSDATNVVRGGCAFNKDFSILAIAGTTGNLNFYSVDKSNGNPELNLLYTYNGSGVINGFNDICFDDFGNVYAVDNSKEVFICIQLPSEGTTNVTPARPDQAFTLETSIAPQPSQIVIEGVEEGVAISVKPGDTFQLNASVEPAEAAQEVTFTSSDESLATVDANGLVTFVAPESLAEVLRRGAEGEDIRNVDITVASVADPTVQAVASFEIDYTPTGVETIDGAKAIAGVEYINASGVAASTPFQGVNIVVTKYTDGTQSIAKVVK